MKDLKLMSDRQLQVKHRETIAEIAGHERDLQVLKTNLMRTHVISKNRNAQNLKQNIESELAARGVATN